MSELVRCARVKQPTLSKAIDCLERKRLVERARSDKDLRYCRVLLSKPGRVVAERLLRCVCRHWAALYRSLGTGDVERLERALAHLNRALDDMAKGAPYALTTSVR